MLAAAEQSIWLPLLYSIRVPLLRVKKPTRGDDRWSADIRSIPLSPSPPLPLACHIKLLYPQQKINWVKKKGKKRNLIRFRERSFNMWCSVEVPTEVLLVYHKLQKWIKQKRKCCFCGQTETSVDNRTHQAEWKEYSYERGGIQGTMQPLPFCHGKKW